MGICQLLRHQNDSSGFVFHADLKFYLAERRFCDQFFVPDILFEKWVVHTSSTFLEAGKAPIHKKSLVTIPQNLIGQRPRSGFQSLGGGMETWRLLLMLRHDTTHANEAGRHIKSAARAGCILKTDRLTWTVDDIDWSMNTAASLVGWILICSQKKRCFFANVHVGSLRMCVPRCTAADQHPSTWASFSYGGACFPVCPDQHADYRWWSGLLCPVSLSKWPWFPRRCIVPMDRYAGVDGSHACEQVRWS